MPMPMMAGQGLPGMGAPPMPGPPPDAMGAMGMLSNAPSPDGEQQALMEASEKVGLALARAWLRSPKAARLLADALKKIQDAREALDQAGKGPVGAPPDLGGMAPPAPMGPPGMSGR